jgi:hypothetical protein
MSEKEGPFDLLFGIGFKVGFLVAIAGLILFYMPFFERAAALTLTYTGFLDSFAALPTWLQLVVGGLMLVGLAIVMGTLKGLVEKLVHGVFGKD